MSNKGLRIIWGAGVVLAVIAALATTAGCGTRAFPTGTFDALDGSSKLEFGADGTYVATVIAFGLPGVDMERGTYRVSGNQVVIKGDYCGTTEGTYTWAFNGKSLKFTAVSDACADRNGSMVGVDWTKE
jgi:hypothetical protein